MATHDNTAQGSAAPVEISKKFKDMSLLEKAAYSGKALLCILTFGFAFPNIFSD
jgi:hypothetical protein